MKKIVVSFLAASFLAVLSYHTFSAQQTVATPGAFTKINSNFADHEARIATLETPVSGISPIVDTSTTNQNNLTPTGLQHGSVLLLQGAGSNFINGISALSAEEVITVINDTDDYLKGLSNQNTNSLAANRFCLPGSFPVFLFPNDTITLRYDGRRLCWAPLVWTNRGQAMGLNEFSDFFGITGPWSTLVSGTGATVIVHNQGVSSPEFAMGVTALSAGTTTTGRASLGSTTTSHIFLTRGALLSVARVAPLGNATDGTETYAFYSGFHTFQNGTIGSGVAWEYRWNGSAPEWSQTVAKSSTVVRSTTGSPAVSGTDYLWTIVFINPASTRADFIYSTDSMEFTKASSVSSGLPDNTTPVAYDTTIIKSAGTTNRSVAIDLMGYRIDAGQRG